MNLYRSVGIGCYSMSDWFQVHFATAIGHASLNLTQGVRQEVAASHY